MANRLPNLVSKICFACSAWLVGGAAREDDPKDYDVAVPFSQWKTASMFVPPDAVPNSFGGWRFESDGYQVDLWPCDLGELMTKEKCRDLYHPNSGSRFKRV